MPTPQEFIDRGEYRAGGPTRVEAKLDGTVYDVAPYGDDAVQVLEKGTGKPVAVLGFKNGRFVVPGKEE